MSNLNTQRLSLPDLLRRFSVLIALFWLGLAVVTNVFVPQLEKVAQQHNVSLSPQDAPSLQASKRIGKVFHEFDSAAKPASDPGSPQFQECQYPCHLTH